MIRKLARLMLLVIQRMVFRGLGILITSPTVGVGRLSCDIYYLRVAGVGTVDIFFCKKKKIYVKYFCVFKLYMKMYLLAADYDIVVITESWLQPVVL